MFIKSYANGFVIVKKRKEDTLSYFAFFVDHDRSSWSMFERQAAVFKNLSEANEAFGEIKARAKLRRTKTS